MTQADVAIAGGGIIGLATALELRTIGRHVVVFDRSEAMSEASRAAAGMLAGADPENPRELGELARLSLRLYPEFLRKVEYLTGTAVRIRTTTTLQGVKHLPPGAQGLPESEIQRLAPGVDTRGWTFYLLQERSYDAWDLAETLPKAARAAGVEIYEHTPVQQVQSTPAGVELRTGMGMVMARDFLNAAGAWSPDLDSSLPVAPLKGHMLTAELPGEPEMHCVLRTPRVYIVPRGAHRYTIGPTLEEAGFDRNVYPDRVQALFEKAVELWPPLATGRIAESWAGLRPGSADSLPIIDETEPHCWVATGHFKNGILLGPGTGRIVAQLIAGEAPDVDPASFTAARFAASAAAR